MFISCLNVNLDLLELHNIEKPSYELDGGRRGCPS